MLDNDQWIGLVVFVGATYINPSFRGRSEGTMEKYNRSNDYKFPLRPPGWLFGPVWLILYGLIAASGYLYWDESVPSTLRDVLLAFYFINLVLNKIWTPLFFDQGRRKWAFFIIILILLTAITVTVLLAIEGFWLSFGLYIPYPIWVLFASYLNLQFIRMDATTTTIIRPVNPVKRRIKIQNTLA